MENVRKELVLAEAGCVGLGKQQCGMRKVLVWFYWVGMLLEDIAQNVVCVWEDIS